MKQSILRRTLNSLLLVGALSLAGTPKIVSADPILSTMGSGTTSNNFTRGNVWDAYKFESGTTGATVRSIWLDIDQFSQPDQWLGATIRLYSGDGVPTSLLGVFVLSNYTIGDSIATFGDENSAVVLAPGTTYWLGIAGIGANATFITTGAPTYDSNGLSGYVFDTVSNFSNSEGADDGWGAPFSLGAVPVVTLDSTALVVPEPASVLLLGLGGLALLARRVRRANKLR